MKNNEEKDPLTKQDFDQKEPVKKKSKPPKEEEESKKTEPEQEEQNSLPGEPPVAGTEHPAKEKLQEPASNSTEDQPAAHPGNTSGKPVAESSGTAKTSGKKDSLLDDSDERKINDSYDDEVDHEEHEMDEEAIRKHREKEEQESAEVEEEEDEEEVEEVEKVEDEEGDEDDEDDEDNGDVEDEEDVEDVEDEGDQGDEGDDGNAMVSGEDEDAKEDGEDDKKEVQEQIKGQERVNYSLLSKGDLVKLLSEKLDNPAKGNIRRDVEEIRRDFYAKVRESRDDKKKQFLKDGGNLEDFKPVEDPLEKEMKDLLKKYRGLKAEFNKQLEKSKQENLDKKQEILEQFRIVMEGQERFEITFRKFKDLQRQWFSVGVVPQQNLKDLWDSYNYFVDKFNDYVRINRELRALDLKKNLELKIQLCEQTESLDKEQNIVQAFKKLQKHHARWREIGPVPRENRDEIWERFKLATSVINRKHQEYHSRMKESLYDNLRRKEELCEKVEAFASNEYNSHSAWAENTNKVLDIQKTWKSIGYAPKKDNNAIYARFRKACDTFFNNKAKFYAAAYEEQKQNLKLKLEITEKAEELSTSEDWKDTTNELIRLQKQWKEIGPVPRRDSDKLWKRFRAACDTFFNNKSNYFEDIDSTFDDNLKAKEELIREMDAYAPSKNKKSNLAALEEFQSRFNDIGFVPAAKKDWIKDQFRHSQDRLLEKTGMDESERSIYRFRQRVHGIVSSPRSEMKLNFERDKLMNKLQQLKNDIGVWENNVGFIKQSDSSETTIQGFHEKIDSARERIQLLEQKIRILDDIENEN